MSIVMPTSVTEAVSALASCDAAMVLAGGTDLMVEINDGRLRPGHDAAVQLIVALDRIGELRSWRLERSPTVDRLFIGAGLTWSELMDPSLERLAPALAQAARTVGSPQIRNAGTIGGNLGTCSPAGDGLAVLAALDAVVHLVSHEASRDLSIDAFMVGPKRTALAAGELILGVSVPVVEGWQSYAKVGVRNAMVIATASACLVADTAAQRISIALGSVGPTVLRCGEAEAFISEHIDWDASTVSSQSAQRFAEMVAATARPRDDHRSSAAYRRHAVRVLAERLLVRSLGGSPPSGSLDD
jgi:CO/xanthine dehydrogenase FAD-binding subunit